MPVLGRLAWTVSSEESKLKPEALWGQRERKERERERERGFLFATEVIEPGCMFEG
jgi:hypothetical protein